jgi:hypothetical protein
MEEKVKKRCMVCGKGLEAQGSICASCQERIRKEALGEHDKTRIQSERELRKQGVTPEEKR